VVGETITEEVVGGELEEEMVPEGREVDTMDVP
jgi:hypothetical protein